MARLAGAIVGGSVALAVLGARADGQTPDFARAKGLYEQATAEMDAGKFDDAARDFGAAYELTHDPVLFFKIAGANEQAGRCPIALVYYGRYLKEAKPAAKFVEVTDERIKACGGTPEPVPAGQGSAVPQAGSASAPQAGSDAASGSATVVASGSASEPPGDHLVHPGRVRNTAWLFTGGTVAFVVAGAVLAYSASSTEQDVRDLYVNGINGEPPIYNATTQRNYKNLVDEGHRYQDLSWTSFGLAAGCAAVAAVLFVKAHGEAQVAPAVTPQGAGVSASWSF
ncbi:MAG TPA: hypothetical protein VLX92_30255 [Kofleriaceae bacterium]|nr:hypothetical protein [Kofleriaceae bacterium]